MYVYVCVHGIYEYQDIESQIRKIDAMGHVQMDLFPILWQSLI